MSIAILKDTCTVEKKFVTFNNFFLLPRIQFFVYDSYHGRSEIFLLVLIVKNKNNDRIWKWDYEENIGREGMLFWSLLRI